MSVLVLLLFLLFVFAVDVSVANVNIAIATSVLNLGVCWRIIYKVKKTFPDKWNVCVAHSLIEILLGIFSCGDKTVGSIEM